MNGLDAPLSPLNPCEIDQGACEALWRAVLHQNRLDATGEALSATSTKRKIERLCEIIDARRWYASEDFREVCALADCDEDAELAVAAGLKANGWKRTRDMQQART